MKALVVEDDFTSRRILQKLLQPHGEVHVVVNGKEALEAVRLGHEESEPYDLICLDIMMPEMDGHTALREIRQLEGDRGIAASKAAKVIMTTALNDSTSVFSAFEEQCEAYLVKPVDGRKLQKHLGEFGLIS